jgi:hypothetical protein
MGPAIRDTRVRLVLLVFYQAHATPNDHFVLQMPPRLSITARASHNVILESLASAKSVRNSSCFRLKRATEQGIIARDEALA